MTDTTETRRRRGGIRTTSSSGGTMRTRANGCYSPRPRLRRARARRRSAAAVELEERGGLFAVAWTPQWETITRTVIQRTVDEDTFETAAPFDEQQHLAEAQCDRRRRRQGGDLMTEMSEEAIRGLEELAAEREVERNAEAAKQLTEDELEMAARFKLSPREYLRYKSVRP